MAKRTVKIDSRKIGRVCIPAGIHYVLDGYIGGWERSRAWNMSPSNKALCGRMLGVRNLDGRQVVAVRVRNRVYAAWPSVIRTRRGKLV